jgi:NAD(P)H-flavin reductase/hemoglobin-like flavoprotein
VDPARITASFRRVSAYGTELTGWFYAHLFLSDPALRDMFPASMAAQNAHLRDALARIVAAVSAPQDLTGYLRHLGVTHRRFGVVTDGGHYKLVGASLLATLAEFEGPAWTPELEADWTEAYGLIAGAMADAARQDEATGSPPWWDARVTATRRQGDVTVLTAQLTERLEAPLSWVAGQSLPVEAASRPLLWRWYSPAHPPRPNGLIEVHVRLVDGGQVSTALSIAGEGLPLRVGAPGGALAYTGSRRPLLLAGWSTGLAPMEAIVRHLAAGEGRDCPWLTVRTVLTPAGHGEAGGFADLLTRENSWDGYDAYVAGPSAMVSAVAAALAGAGVARENLHIEDFGWNEPGAG